MFKWFGLRRQVIELESILRVNEHQLDVARGEIERLSSERNYLMDAVLRSVGAAQIYNSSPADTKPIEQEVARDHPAPRNMREFQATLQQLEELERRALS